ncbi:hypothetical protein F5Y06DRAFT_300862 [Hypoxylon sp. FL0890]|nr:hypothetical protein F5Y06DRAFT_300862 [Hypoxylon sp. FL0890]
MCQQYTYISLCRSPGCQTVFGSKKRNRYCPEALRARRLGHCSTGIQVADPIGVRERIIRCDPCKQQIALDRVEELDRDRNPDNAWEEPSDIAMAPAPRSQSQDAHLSAGIGEDQDDNVDLFDFVFANPLAKAEAELKAEIAAKQKKRATGQAADEEEEEEEDEEREVFVVRTPERETRPSSHGRGHGRGRGGRPRVFARGRGSRHSARRSQVPRSSQEPQNPSSQGAQAQEAREIPLEERLPYGFPAEGEVNRPVAEQFDEDDWEDEDEDIEMGT